MPRGNFRVDSASYPSIKYLFRPYVKPGKMPFLALSAVMRTKNMEKESVRLLIVSDSFPPVRHSGTFRVEGLVKYLPRFGVIPFVFTRACSTPWDHGHADEGQPLLPESQVFRGEWYRTDHPPWARIAHKILDAVPLGWSLARRIRWAKTVGSVKDIVKKIAKTVQPDAVLATSPSPEALLIGEFLRDSFGLPLICDFRDPWSFFPATKYRHYLDFLLERHRELCVLRKATLVLTNTPTARRLFCETFRMPAEKVAILPNGYDEAVFREAERLLPILPQDKFHILHAGSLPGKAKPGRLSRVLRWFGFSYHPTDVNWSHHSPWYLLAAVERLLQQHPSMRKTLRVVFVGPVEEHERRRLDQFRFSECIQIFVPVPEVQAARMMFDASLLVLLQLSQYLRGQEFCTVIPGKTYSYLRSGTPILAPVSGRDIRELITRFEAGICVDPEDVTGIAEVIRTCWQRWTSGQHTRRPFSPDLAEYSRETMAFKLSELLWECLKHGEGRTVDRAHSEPAPPLFVDQPLVFTGQHELENFDSRKDIMV